MCSVVFCFGRILVLGAFFFLNVYTACVYVRENKVKEALLVLGVEGNEICGGP